MSSDIDEAIQQARREKASTHKQGLTGEDKAQLHRVFELFDADGGGSIDATELRTVMKALGFEVTKQDVAAMIAEIDVDGNGTVDFSEFLLLIEGASAQTDPRRECRKAFSQFLGGDDAETIIMDDILRVAQGAGSDITEEKALAMLRVADPSNSGEVTLEQFMEIMHRTGLA